MLEPLFVIYLKFTFNWAPCILSVSSIHTPFIVPHFLGKSSKFFGRAFWALENLSSWTSPALLLWPLELSQQPGMPFTF